MVYLNFRNRDVRPWLRALLCIATLICEKRGHTMDFTTSGFLVVKTITTGPKVWLYTNTFDVEFSGCRYLMKVSGYRPQAPQLLSVDMLFDGTNTFFFERFDTNYTYNSVAVLKNGYPVEEKTQTPVHAKNSANARVSTGPVPPTKDVPIVLVWLAFGAHCYYAAQSNSLQSSILFLGPAYELRDIRLRTEWVLSQKIPGFLQKRMDHDGGNRYYLNRDGALVTTSRPGALAAGYVNSLYTVLEWTNVVERYFPRHFELEKYGPTAESPGDVQTNLVAEGWTTAVHCTDVQLALRPTTQSNTMMHDGRLSVATRERPFAYFSKPGTLDNPDTVKKRRDYNLFRTSEPSAPRLSGRGAFFGILLLAVLSLPLLPLAWRRVVTKKRTTRTQIDK